MVKRVLFTCAAIDPRSSVKPRGYCKQVGRLSVDLDLRLHVVLNDRYLLLICRLTARHNAEKESYNVETTSDELGS